LKRWIILNKLLDFFSLKICEQVDEKILAKKSGNKNGNSSSFALKFDQTNIAHFNQVIYEFKELKSSIKSSLRKKDYYKLVCKEVEVGKLADKLRSSVAYRKICEMVCMNVILSEGSKTQSFKTLASETDVKKNLKNEALIHRLEMQLQQYAKADQERKEYIHQVNQMIENLRKENYDLNLMIQKIKTSSEREVNAREIENNELRKRLDGLMKAQKHK